MKKIDKVLLIVGCVMLVGGFIAATATNQFYYAIICMAGLFIALFPFCKWMGSKSETATPTEPTKQVKSVKILGTRAGEETRIFATYNFTIYSILIVYVDGSKEVVECKGDSSRFKELVPYITTDDMIEMDAMDD